jgi:hypothetical protein
LTRHANSYSNARLEREKKEETMKLLRLLVVMALIAVPSAVCAKEAKTIDDLVKKYDSSSCKVCHAEIYEQWEKSHHARPLMGLKGGIFLKGVLKSAFAPKNPGLATRENFPCFKCHLPQALDAADSVSAEIAKAVAASDSATIAKLQITCLVCHNKMAILHRLQEGQPEKGVVYGSKDIAAHGDKKYKKVKKSSIMDHAIMCGQCHGLGPNFDAENPYQCATLYGNYIHAYIPRGGTKSCQDCHMEEVGGKAGHRIAPDWNDLELSGELLKKSVYLDVQTLGYEWLKKSKDLRPMVVVNTKIWQMAGHAIPDG